MGWDGAGNLTRTGNFSADKSAGVKILASVVDRDLDDIYSAIGVALARDGQNEATGNLPMGGNRFLNVGAAASATNFVRVAEFVQNIPIYAVDESSDTANVTASVPYYVTVSANQAPPDGAEVLVRTSFGSASAKDASAALMLVTPFGTHSANIIQNNGHPITRGQIRGVQTFIYASTVSSWVCMNPWAGQRLFTCQAKAITAAGATAGTQSDTTLVRGVKNGDLLYYGIETHVSVSISVSANQLFLSGVPSEFLNNISQGNPAHQVQAFVSANEITLYTVAANGTRGIEFRTVQNIESFPVGTTVLSTDNVVRIPSHTAFWVTLGVA